MNTNIQKLKDLIKAKAEYQIELKKNISVLEFPKQISQNVFDLGQD